MKDLNLGQYELVPVEPLHDLKEHINNILKELPKHLTEEENALFDESVEVVLSTKEKLRGHTTVSVVLLWFFILE